MFWPERLTYVYSKSKFPLCYNGETVETVSDFIFGGSKISADGDCSHAIKMLVPWKERYDQPRKKEERKWSRSVMPDSVTPWTVACTKLLHPWDFLGKSTGVGCPFLLQGIFPTQGSNPGLPHSRKTLYHLSHQGSPINYWIILQTYNPRKKSIQS